MKVNGLVRLTKDAEGKVFGERMVINMSVADSNRIKRNGNWIDEVMYIDADYWVSATSSILNYLKKGQQVYIDDKPAARDEHGETSDVYSQGFYQVVLYKSGKVALLKNRVVQGYLH